MAELSIGEATQVTLHFSVELIDGHIVDSNFEKKPASFIFGDGKLLPGFEDFLSGLVCGDQKTFIVPAEKAFGQKNPNNIQSIDRAQFSESTELTKGLMLSFADAKGNELPGVVSDFDEDNVTIDFNHPLAGREIVFKVHILNIEPAVTH